MTDDRDEDELTPDEASALLGLSLQEVIQKMDTGELPFRATESGKWVHLDDVLSFELKLERQLAASGKPVDSDNDEIPLAEAATILGLSMRVLIRKMDMGELTFRLVPEERWVRMQEVLALKEKLERNREALRALAEDTKELHDILENTPPVLGSGSFLKDRGYLDPAKSKESFLLVGRIHLATEAAGLDAKGVATAVTNSGIAGFFNEEQILRILRGQIRNTPTSTLWALVKILEMYPDRPTKYW
jgi:hypothetical protein